MARDYKSRAQPKEQPRHSPTWVWMLGGFLLGALSVGLLCLKLSPPGGGGDWARANPGKAETRPKGDWERQDKQQKRADLRFDFYNMLPEMEVVVPDEELHSPSVATPSRAPERKPEVAGRNDRPPAPVVEAKAADRYVLQVASFRSSADADRLKAELAFMGYRASVQPAVIARGDTRYRVRIGPFSGTPAVQGARRKLASNGHKAMVIRLGAAGR